MKENNNRFLPLYALISLGIMLVFNLVPYSVAGIIVADKAKYDLSVGLDALIPFCAPFIVVYILSYVQWLVGYIVIVRDSREACYNLLAVNVLSKVLAFFIFILLPSTIVRPEINGTGLYNYLVNFIYSVDEPVNLLPSIHCLESYCVLRYTIGLKKPCRAYKIIICTFSVLVFASVVLVKQHVILDIPAAIIIVELSALIVYFARLIFKNNKKCR